VRRLAPRLGEHNDAILGKSLTQAAKKAAGR